MSNLITTTDFVGLVAQEIAFGIDDAAGYWLGRIERELRESGLSPAEQLRAIELILQEYKATTGNIDFDCAQA